MTKPIDPELLEAMAQHRTSRRRFLGMGGLALGGLAMGPTLLAACSSDSNSSGGGSSDGITVLNWPLYIEGDEPSTSATLKGFTSSTGIKVDYRNSIDGNESFNTKYQATLEKGQGIGADLIVLTSWNAAAYIGANLVQPFDSAAFPNKILDEMRDTVGLTMLGMGANPTTGTTAQMLAAVDKIEKARDAGQFKKVTGNSYTEDLAIGDTWIAVAWSGDVAQLQADNPGLEWVIPSQGGMLWVDNAMIPVGAKNPEGANKLLNYVYDPAVAGPLYESILYIPPVTGAEKYMTATAQASPFIVPPATPPLYEFDVISPDVDDEVERAFVAATEQ